MMGLKSIHVNEWGSCFLDSCNPPEWQFFIICYHSSFSSVHRQQLRNLPSIAIYNCKFIHQLSDWKHRMIFLRGCERCYQRKGTWVAIQWPGTRYIQPASGLGHEKALTSLQNWGMYLLIHVLPSKADPIKRRRICNNYIDIKPWV